MFFFKKIFSPLVLVISFLLLIYTSYKSEIYWDGNKRDYFFYYYIISLLLIFFSILTFFISNKIKEYLIISSVSFILSLYLFESYLNFNNQFSKEQSLKEKLYKNQTGKNWDKRSKFQMYLEQKKVNENTSIKVNPNFFLNKYDSIFPLSGISYSETINCNENGYFAIYLSDRYGFNNPDKEWEQNEIEYLLVGDSFTHGACVNRPHDISSVLRKLSNKSVLNLGYEDNGPLIEFATLREYLHPKVKKVLWIYYEENDFKDLNKEIINKILISYLNNSNFTQNLKSRQNEVDEIVSNYLENKIIDKKIKRESANTYYMERLNEFVKLSKLRSLLHNKQLPRPPLEFKKILEQAKNLTTNNNSKLYFIYLPSYNRYKSKYYKSNYDYVKNVVNELNIPFIDIEEKVFKKEKNPLKLFPFSLYGHYNVEGYKKVSEAIYKFTID